MCDLVLLDLLTGGGARTGRRLRYPRLLHLILRPVQRGLGAAVGATMGLYGHRACRGNPGSVTPAVSCAALMPPDA
eukprot:1758561-Heterocapsa_arctica.AAC.2